MKNIIVFISTFIIVYFMYLIFVIFRNKKLNQLESSIEIKYLKAKFKIDISKINIIALAHMSALSNSLIIAITITIINNIQGLLLKMIVGFVILIPLQLIVYQIIGIYYKKKERRL